MNIPDPENPDRKTAVELVREENGFPSGFADTEWTDSTNGILDANRLRLEQQGFTPCIVRDGQDWEFSTRAFDTWDAIVAVIARGGTDEEICAELRQRYGRREGEPFRFKDTVEITRSAIAYKGGTPPDIRREISRLINDVITRLPYTER